jgi:hypothetical protein
MDPIIMNNEKMAYVRSESEFSHARLRGFLEMVLAMLRGHDMHLLSFDEVIEKLRLKQSIYRGLQDIPIEQIVGSTGRYEDFTRHFLPRVGDRRNKERWRNIYTLAVTGKGFPPIDVYKIDEVYFVKDGNHRVSVARDLGWKTIQGHITELPSSISLTPDVEPDDLLIKGECAYFLEQTQLDKNRPDSKQHIDFTEPGGYQKLLRHIGLRQYFLSKPINGKAVKEQVSFQEAATDWYDQVYLPLIEAVQQADILNDFPNRRESDLYIWLVTHQQALSQQHDLSTLELPDEITKFLQILKHPDDNQTGTK